MLSSLAHVLIVTPAIFLWLRERELRRQPQAEELPPALAPQAFPTSLQGELL
jgi:copper/silver efflux system protein